MKPERQGEGVWGSWIEPPWQKYKNQSYGRFEVHFIQRQGGSPTDVGKPVFGSKWLQPCLRRGWAQSWLDMCHLHVSVGLGKSKCRQSRNSEDISGSLLIMAHSQRSQHQSGLSKTPEAGRIASWKCLGLWLLKRNWRFLMCTGTFLSEAHGVVSFSKDSNSHSIPDTSTSWPSALHSDLPTWGILQERSRGANLSIVNQAHQTSVFTGGFKYCQVFKHSHLVPLPGILV